MVEKQVISLLNIMLFLRCCSFWHYTTLIYNYNNNDNKNENNNLKND